MNPDIQMQTNILELKLQKVVLDTKIQRAVLASQRLSYHEEYLSDMIEDILTSEKTLEQGSIDGGKSGQQAIESLSKITVLKIPRRFVNIMFKLFSGRA